MLLAKRALLALMRALAVTYNVTLNCNRDSTDKEIISNCRELALRVHPDRGGNTAHHQQLNDARAACAAVPFLFFRKMYRDRLF